MKRKIRKEDLANYKFVILVLVITTILLIYGPDRVPATQVDYEQLENQVALIKENPGLLSAEPETDIAIFVTVDNEITTVEFKNYICCITEKYNKQSTKPFSCSKTSRHEHWLLVLVAAFIGGLVFSYALYIFMEIFKDLHKVILKILKNLVN